MSIFIQVNYVLDLKIVAFKLKSLKNMFPFAIKSWVDWTMVSYSYFSQNLVAVLFLVVHKLSCF